MRRTINGRNFFLEEDEFVNGIPLAIELDEKIYDTVSPFQKIEIYKTTNSGLMLVLDGVIQTVELDEFVYHEMFVHVPVNAHPAPEKVLVVGGGDGGLLRELARYSFIKEISIVEIDEAVIETSKRFLPFVSKGFDDSRVNVIIDDGARFIDACEKTFDLILVDSSDPSGPSEVLFGTDFYKAMRRALKPGGIAVAQAQNIWINFKDIIAPLYRKASDFFKTVEYYYAGVPTYTSGQIGFLACSEAGSLREPLSTPADFILSSLKYYTPEIHRQSFTLPAFAGRILNENSAGRVQHL